MSVHPWAAAAVSSGKERITTSYGFTDTEVTILSALAHAIEQGSRSLSQHGAPEAAVLGGLIAAAHELKNLPPQSSE